MLSHIVSVFVLVLGASVVFVSAVADINARGLEERATCNHDNPLRALSQNAAAASTFCSTFIPLVTVTTTVYPNPAITPRL